MSHLVGIDVGGTTTRAVRFDGTLAAGTALSAPTPQGAEAVCAQIAALVDEIGDGAAPTAVGVGLPGRVDAERGIVSAAVNLGISQPVAVGEVLAARLGAPVHLENDVNAAAVGTFAHLGLGATSSLAYVNVGTGLAAGFVLDGHLLRGATGGAGEIGHVPLRPDGPLCLCGQRGCGEVFGAGRAAGDDPARRSDVVEVAAWAVQLCVLMLDVDVVTVGGGMTLRPGFFDDLEAVLEAKQRQSPLLASAGLAVRVRPAPAGVPVGNLGAVLAARAAMGLE